MTAAAPVSIPYNLGRLGQTGDEITFDAGVEERAALAVLAECLDVPKFSVRITLKKLSPTQFEVACDLAAEIVQACVVTLEPLVARVATDFTRELHFVPPLRRAPGEAAPVAKEIVVGAEDDEVPEQIESLHYDLAGPVLEEFLLAIDPYPRAPGVEFAALDEGADKPESPFAVLKGLKSDT